MEMLAGLIVGVLLGWLATWLIQNRLDDDMRHDLARLEREMAETKNELAEAKAQLADSESMVDTRASTDAAVVVAAVEMEEVADEGIGDEDDQLESPIEDTSVDTMTDSADSEIEVEKKKVAILYEPEVIADPESEENDEQVEVVSLDAAEDITVDTVRVVDRSAGEVDLTVIRGVGPKFAAKLQEGGVTTYAQLANTSPNELNEIIQPAAWQQVDYAEWITQAESLSRQTQRLQIGDDLSKIEGIGPTYATALRAAGITTFQELAQSDEEALAAATGAPAWRRAGFSDWIAQAELAAAGNVDALDELQSSLNRRDQDKIGLIKGIGSTTEAAFTAAGIESVADLAQSTPEQLTEILTRAGVRRGNVETWIEEAKTRSAGARVPRSNQRTRTVPQGANMAQCPQDLGRIEGVGETYEQRLYNAGIGAYWEVGMLSTDDLTAVLQVKSFQGVNLEAMQTSARELAAETDSVGRVWDGTEPDDFEILEGIGPVFESRLYDAGICTFAQLAELNEQRLQEICQAPPSFSHNFGRWLEQAQAEVS